LPMDDPNYPWLAIALGYPVMGVWFWCTDQSMVQSVLGAKSLKQGQLGANFTGWLKIFDVALFIIPGIVCFILFPDLADPDEAYMTMVTRLFPAGMTGLVMAVLIAALVSTIDSALNSLSTVFTMDIYVKKYKPEASQKDIVKIGRMVTAIGAVLGVVMAIGIDSIKGLNLFDVFQSVLGFIAPPLSVVFLTGVFWKKMTTKAANVILIAGTVISIGTGITYLFILPSSEYDFWPHFLMLSFYIFVVLMILAVVVASLDREGQKADNELDMSRIGKPDRKVMIAWIALIVVMVSLYLFFNGH